MQIKKYIEIYKYIRINKYTNYDSTSNFQLFETEPRRFNSIRRLKSIRRTDSSRRLQVSTYPTSRCDGGGVGAPLPQRGRIGRHLQLNSRIETMILQMHKYE